MTPRVTDLVLYPFKSAAGIPVQEVHVGVAGLRDDRRWMVVDADGRFVSQRTHPPMALLRPRLLPDAVEVEAPGVGVLTLDRASAAPEGCVTLRVWSSDRWAVDCGDDAARWASRYLGTACRVVEAVRPEGGAPLSDDGRVQAGFADASPALVISHASLADLNGRLERALPMNRFRPNVVVEGFGAFEEDAWGLRRIGDVPTRGRKPCVRCATTLVDQDTAEKGVEPLRTLATFRRDVDGEVAFGMNIYFEGEGVIRVGDRVG